MQTGPTSDIYKFMQIWQLLFWPFS